MAKLLQLVLFHTIVKHLVDFNFRLDPVIEGALVSETTLFGEVIGRDLNHFMAVIRTDSSTRRHPGFFCLNPAFMGSMTAESELSGMVTIIVYIHFLTNIGVM
jgi:hypothetical protein